ncbi:MAG TPA: PspA/IM30 family protein [Armatimonadota bacterium]|nr:PspA/IM30 family protein [Armatimonadota bacterium]
MGLWTRLGTLLGARAHDALSRAEDPVTLVNYHVARMQEGVERAREEIARAIAAERRLSMQSLDARKAAIGWDARARWAISRGDDELAREALRRKNAADATAESYDRAHAQQAQAVAELKTTLGRLTDLLRQAKTRRAVLLAHRDAARAQHAAARGVTRITGADSAEAFERLAAAIEGDSAQAAALLAVHADDADARFQALEEQAVIEEALQSLKQEMGRLPDVKTAGAIEGSEETS